MKDFRKIQDIQLTVTSDRWRESSNSNRFLSFGSYYKLRYPTVEARSLFSSRLQAEIEKYLRTRLVGHTREFALASLTNSNWGRAGVEASKAALLKMYKEVPESWLQPWSEGGKQVGYYVVDGELAWTFRLMVPVPWLQVADAQEFDPKLKEAFAAARQKAEENLAARGVERRMGYSHYYWAELKKVLREEHKVQWRCPTDLNHGIYD